MTIHAPGIRTLGRYLLDRLIRLYPPTFRHTFGDDLRETFLARLDAARERRGPLGVLAFLARQLPDIAFAALAERHAARRERPARRPRDECHPARSGGTMRSFLLDLRLALRTLSSKNRAMATVAVGTLAVGIGATTAIISVVKGVLFDPLPFPEPERIVRLYHTTERNTDLGFLAGPTFVDLRARAASFEAMGGFYDYTDEGIDLTGGGSAERLTVLKVSSGFFEALGTPPAFGRTFTRDEEIPPGAATRDTEQFAMVTAPAAPVAVLGHALFDRHFDGDPDALGRTIELDGTAYTAIGVMPPGFGDAIGVGADLWLPLDLAPGGLNVRYNNYLSAVARLRPGVRLARAQAEIDAVSATLAAEHPQTNDGVSARLVPLADDLVGGARRMLLVLLAAGGLVLLVCTVNVANLFLVRGLGREREMSVRAALGAGPLRLLGAGAAEGLLTAAIGGLTGLGLALAGIALVLRLRPEALPRHDTIAVDAPVLAFALAATAAVGLCFSLIPGTRALRRGPVGVGLRGSVGQARPGLRRAQSALLVAQVAAALVLLTGGGLLMRSFAALHAVDLGFAPAGVVTFKLRLPDYRYGEPEARLAFYRRLHEQLGATAGVRASGATSKLPADGHRNRWGFGIEGRERVEGDPPPIAEIRCVDGELFETLGVRLLDGRRLDHRDRTEAEPAVLVSRALAQRYFPDGDALGARLQVGGGDPRTVVGVVADTRARHRERPMPQIFVPHEQFAANRNWDLTFAVATDGGSDTAAATAAIRDAIARLDPLLAVYDVRSMDQVAAHGIARSRFATLSMSVFATVAMLLAAVGIYGTLSFAVRNRIGEIGVRKALGAQAADVLRLVLGQGLAVTTVGLVLGAVGALALGRSLESLLFEVPGRDPLTLATTAAVLLGVAVLAGLLPARRAAAVDPARVLRTE